MEDVAREKLTTVERVPSRSGGEPESAEVVAQRRAAERRRRHEDEVLDEALLESFPDQRSAVVVGLELCATQRSSSEHQRNCSPTPSPS